MVTITLCRDYLNGGVVAVFHRDDGVEARVPINSRGLLFDEVMIARHQARAMFGLYDSHHVLH